MRNIYYTMLIVFFMFGVVQFQLRKAEKMFEKNSLRIDNCRVLEENYERVMNEVRGYGERHDNHRHNIFGRVK